MLSKPRAIIGRIIAGIGVVILLVAVQGMIQGMFSEKRDIGELTFLLQILSGAAIFVVGYIYQHVHIQPHPRKRERELLELATKEAYNNVKSKKN